MMNDAMSLVLIDSDFLIKIVLKEKCGRDHFEKLMVALGKTPAIHEYVYNHELSMHPAIMQMVEEGAIKVIKYEDFLEGHYIGLYKKQAIALYAVMNQGQRPEIYSDEEILTHRRAKKSLGEIHTVLLANFALVPIICSNDQGTKDLKRHLEGDGKERFRVFDSFDLILELAKEGKHICLSKEVAISINTYSAKDCSTKGQERIKRRNKERKKVLSDLYDRK